MRSCSSSLCAALVLASCTPKGPCPQEMVLVPGGKACIDRWEASLEGGEPGNAEGQGTTARAVSTHGVAPAVQISQLQARAACANAGKRLCARVEWLAACEGQGEPKRKFAYGAAFVAERCSDRPLAKKRGEKPQPTGSMPDCKTPEGVFDLSGNVWEWLADTGPGGNPADLLGGGFGNEGKSMGCRQDERIGQPVTQQGEAMGFRCCKNAAGGG